MKSIRSPVKATGAERAGKGLASVVSSIRRIAVVTAA
jgi:hypothetical protein